MDQRPASGKPLTVVVAVRFAGVWITAPVWLPCRAATSQLNVPPYHEANRRSFVSPASGVLDAPSDNAESLRPTSNTPMPWNDMAPLFELGIGRRLAGHVDMCSEHRLIIRDRDALRTAVAVKIGKLYVVTGWPLPGEFAVAGTAADRSRNGSPEKLGHRKALSTTVATWGEAVFREPLIISGLNAESENLDELLAIA